MFNHGYKAHKKLAKTVEVDVEDKLSGKMQQIECEYLVGADGVKSKVRQDLGIEMIGDKSKLLQLMI